MRLKQEEHKLKHYWKMKIEDVINSYNECLSIERLNLPNRGTGHFVFHRNYTRKPFGNYREYHYILDFINKELKPIPFLEKVFVRQVSNDQEEKILRDMDTEYLSAFFLTIREKKDKEYQLLLTGEYGVK